MQFVLTGFTHEMEFRVFAFDRIGDDWTRTQFTVRTDLTLTRKHGIRLQELPLACQGILQRNEAEASRTITFTGEEMSVYVRDIAAAREAITRKRKTRMSRNGQARTD